MPWTNNVYFYKNGQLPCMIPMGVAKLTTGYTLLRRSYIHVRVRSGRDDIRGRSWVWGGFEKKIV